MSEYNTRNPALQVIPDEMHDWGWLTDGGGLTGKGPTDAAGKNVDKHDPAHHRSLDEVRAEIASRGCGGGPTVPPGFVVFDADKCFMSGGKLKPWARFLLKNTVSHAELSPSGTGLHIVVKTDVVPEGETTSYTFKDGSKLEVLGPGAFVRMTGKPFGDRPPVVHDETAFVKRVIDHIEKKRRGVQAPTVATSPARDDGEILAMCRGAANAAKFSDLYDDGNTEMAPYSGDASRADMGLVSMLAFYTQDPSQLDRLFRGSALYRDKWDQQRGRQTYGEKTISKALSGLTDVYTVGDRVLNRALQPSPNGVALNGVALNGVALNGSPNGSAPSEDGEDLMLGYSLRLPIHDYLEDGIEPPKLLIENILYAGTDYEDGSTEGVVQTIYGEPGAGKSMIATWAAIRVMEMGSNVLYIDEEGTRRMVTERLKGLGATVEMLKDHFYYFNSTAFSASDVRHRRELAVIAEVVRPDLVVFDSWIDFLANDGRSENSSDEVVGWAQLVSRPFIAVGATVLILDHIPKDGSGRGARGSGGKLGWVTAGHKLEVKAPFNRDLTGEVKLIRQKDREGALPHVVTFAIGGNGAGKIICRPDATVETSHAVDGLTPNQRDAIEALPVDGATFTVWFDACGISSKDSFTNAIKGLMSRGRVGKDGRLYFHTDPEDAVTEDANVPF